MIAIIDYGVGNIFSLKSSFTYIGEEAVLTRDPEIIKKSDRIVLPGVGAFADAAEKLRKTGMDKIVKEQALSGKPLLGICLGMQLLFDKSMEYGEHQGLGLISGVVEPISEVVGPDYKIPHIGWNALHFPKDREPSPLFRYIREGDHVYFVHSYYAARCQESVIASCEYGASLTASVQRENIYATQFHPEKSGEVGLKILKAFCEL